MKEKKQSAAMSAHRDKMAALEALEDSHGVITPTRLVIAAREETHEFHSSFDWNDTTAAHAHRLDVARRIIRDWQPIRVTSSRTAIRVPVYIRDPSKLPSEQGYVNVSRITDEERKREILLQEFGRAHSALERAYAIADLFGARDQVADLIETINSLKRKTEEVSLSQN